MTQLNRSVTPHLRKKLSQGMLTLIALVLCLALPWVQVEAPVQAKEVDVAQTTAHHSFFFPPYQHYQNRAGFVKTSGHDTTILQAGWYSDGAYNDQSVDTVNLPYARTIALTTQHVENDPGNGQCQAATGFHHVVNATPDQDLLDAVQAHPGSLWLIGRTPYSYFTGGPIHPHLYAEIYHHYYQAIKMVDPTAKVAVGTISQASPSRLAYLDQVLGHYQNMFDEPLKSDLWAVNLYYLNEEDCQSGAWGAALPPATNETQGWQVDFAADSLLDLTALEDSVRLFREWMHRHSQSDLPLMIMEYGVLPPAEMAGFEDEVAAQFLQETFTLFESLTDAEIGLASDDDRLVQLWSWYPTYHPNFGGRLFTDTSENLTLVGNAFVDYGQNNR
ncbi:MAG: hypothetical protein AAF629_07175 [Chloroflexota bacterium]